MKAPGQFYRDGAATDGQWTHWLAAFEAERVERIDGRYIVTQAEFTWTVADGDTRLQDSTQHYTLTNIDFDPDYEAMGAFAIQLPEGTVVHDGDFPDANVRYLWTGERLAPLSGNGSTGPREPASLTGRALPDLKKLGIELPADADGRMLLVYFWDMNQRPSRHYMGVLTRRAVEWKERGLLIFAVQVARPEDGALEKWIEQNQPPFPVGRITGDVVNTQFEWGAVSLPHLVLTNRDHVVVGEGLSLLEELDERIEEISAGTPG